MEAQTGVGDRVPDDAAQVGFIGNGGGPHLGEPVPKGGGESSRFPKSPPGFMVVVRRSSLPRARRL